MDYAFAPEQLQLQRLARKVLAARAQPDQDGIDRDLWALLGELGLLAAAIPESHGGGGGGAIDLCALAQEVGRAHAAIPLCSSICLAAELIARHGTPDQMDRWLPRLARGSAIGCVAITEQPGTLVPAGNAIAARVQDGRLHGRKQPVQDGCVAHVALVAARADDAESALGVYLVELGGPGVAREPLGGTEAAHRHAVLRFEGAPCEALAGADRSALASALDRAALCAAFEQLGRAERAVDLALAKYRQHPFH